MPAASRHGTPSLTSLPTDGEVSCEVRPPSSPIWSLTTHPARMPKHSSQLTYYQGKIENIPKFDEIFASIFVASRHSPRYRKIATTTTTTITTTTKFPFLLNLGLIDFDTNF